MPIEQDMAEGPLPIGRYLIYGEIASGGITAVHFGRLTGVRGFQRTVAVKRFHREVAGSDDFGVQLLEEANRAARIQHPNVAQVLDVVSEGPELLLVMEYVHGETLLALAQQTPAPIDMATVSAILLGVLHGLHAAHCVVDDEGRPLNLVHRALSPRSVMVGRDGVSRIIDFGNAKAAQQLANSKSHAEQANQDYWAPEQLTDPAGTPGTKACSLNGDGRVDVYSAGLLLWELLVGKTVGEYWRTLAPQAPRQLPPPSSFRGEIPRELDEVVAIALSPDPEKRYASARDFAWAIGEVIHPATPECVAEWVMTRTCDLLADRTASLAKIARHSSETRGEGLLREGLPSSSKLLLGRRGTAAASRSKLRSPPLTSVALGGEPSIPISGRTSSFHLEDQSIHILPPQHRRRLGQVLPAGLLTLAIGLALGTAYPLGVWETNPASDSHPLSGDDSNLQANESPAQSLGARERQDLSPRLSAETSFMEWSPLRRPSALASSSVTGKCTDLRTDGLLMVPTGRAAPSASGLAEWPRPGSYEEANLGCVDTAAQP